VGAAGLWGTLLLGGNSNALIGLTYVGGAGAFLLVGGSFLFNLFELCRRDQEGITTSPDQDKPGTPWLHLGLECLGVGAFVSGLIFSGNYRLTLVFVCLLLGYPALRWLARRRTNRNRVSLFRVDASRSQASVGKARR
jgi:hypothetical protein